MQTSTHFTEGCHLSREGYCQSQEADMTIKDFSAFLDIRCKKLGPQNLLKISTWRPVLPVFLRASSASFLISKLNSFQDVLKGRDCSGSSLHTCRTRGKQQYLIGKCLPEKGHWLFSQFFILKILNPQNKWKWTSICPLLKFLWAVNIYIGFQGLESPPLSPPWRPLP